MKQKENRIILDFDDTLVKSSEQVVRMLNKKYGLSKTVKDCKDWVYRSVYPKCTKKDVTDMYSSDEFFDGVELNDGVKEFLNTFKDNFTFVICSKGDSENLKKKKIFCDKVFKDMQYEFKGIPMFGEERHSLNKSIIDFSHCLFCIDDNTPSLESINTPYKILIKNYHEVYWNQMPYDSENVYVINDFYELIEMCKFHFNLKKEGIKLD